MALTPEQLNATAETYMLALGNGDLDAIVDLYAENATVEDPVGGGTVHEGKQAIRDFYATVTALKIETELKETRPCGDELLFHFEITTHFDENSKATIDVWDVMVHDEQGKVRSMKAYWGAANMR